MWIKTRDLSNRTKTTARVDSLKIAPFSIIHTYYPITLSTTIFNLHLINLFSAQRKEDITPLRL